MKYVVGVKKTSMVDILLESYTKVMELKLHFSYLSRSNVDVRKM
jgi:hypothetical protein